MRDPKDEALAYAFRDTRLGTLLVAASSRGVCLVRFGEGRDELLRALEREFPFAMAERQEDALRGWCDAMEAYVEGRSTRLQLPLDVRGSAFQRRVWQQLAEIPPGETRSYSEIAEAIGVHGGARAVARACAANPVPVVIPCHRVIEKTGALGDYSGGPTRKRLLLLEERDVCDASHSPSPSEFSRRSRM